MRQRDKQMQMVRENHVAPNRNAKIVLCAVAELHEGFMNKIIRKMRPTSVSAAGYKINWIARENNVEPSRGLEEILSRIGLDQHSSGTNK